jgi:hypothetical protein
MIEHLLGAYFRSAFARRMQFELGIPVIHPPPGRGMQCSMGSASLDRETTAVREHPRERRPPRRDPIPSWQAVCLASVHRLAALHRDDASAGADDMQACP